MNNKKNGTKFEKETAKYFSKKGFWVYHIPDKINGQPFDLIAAGHGTVFALDCKLCSKDIFDKNRIEVNQHTAMNMFQKLNPDYFAGFAFKFSDNKTVFVSYRVLTECKKRRIQKDELLKMGMEADYESDGWLGD